MSSHPTETIAWTRAGAPALLNDDGTASMATMLMSSHHGMRRDISRIALALAELPNARSDALTEAWRGLRQTLHGHHHAEDQGVFPGIRSAHPELGALFDRLTADHHQIDPLLDRGDREFAELSATAGGARAVVAALIALLDPHLGLEEAQVIPHLRAKQFWAPATEDEADLYAQGFAWSLDGLAPDVQEQMLRVLPEAVVSRLPAARAAFEARSERTWGPNRPTGASRTPVPDWVRSAG